MTHFVAHVLTAGFFSRPPRRRLASLATRRAVTAPTEVIPPPYDLEKALMAFGKGPEAYDRYMANYPEER